MLQLLGVSMGVNLVGWAAASYLKTEKFYDLVMMNMIAIITILVTMCGGYVYEAHSSFVISSLVPAHSSSSPCFHIAAVLALFANELRQVS